MKVHLLDEDYAWIPKRRDFTKVLNEEILGNQGFRDKEASYLCYYAQILPTFVYSYFCVLKISLGAIWTDNPFYSSLEAVWVEKSSFVVS